MAPLCGDGAIPRSRCERDDVIYVDAVDFDLGQHLADMCVSLRDLVAGPLCD